MRGADSDRGVVDLPVDEVSWPSFGYASRPGIIAVSARIHRLDTPGWPELTAASYSYFQDGKLPPYNSRHAMRAANKK